MAFQAPLPVRPLLVPPLPPSPRRARPLSRRRPRPRPRASAPPVASLRGPADAPPASDSSHPADAPRPAHAQPPAAATRPAVFRHTRRALFVGAAAATIALAIPDTPPANSLSLAPTPINPYARRRSERVYKKYVEKLEKSIEAVKVADFKKVVEAGGGGLGVSYRIAGFAAFVASAMSTAVVHPIDSIKTRMQAGVGKREEEEDPEEDAQSQGLFDNLYTGLWSNILKEAPNAAIYLGVYELIKSCLINLSVTSFFHDLPLLTFMVAGALGDAIGSVVRVPAEIVNKRLQLGVNADVRSALTDSFLSPVGREGSAVAWQAVLWRDVPYGGLQIMLYEFGKQMLSMHPGLLGGAFATPGVMCDVLMGALAGAIAAMVTTPADVLVTKLSVQHPQSYLETGKYMGVGSTARRILQDEGIGGFFKGTWQRGVYYAPMIGLFFALYEFNRGWLSHPDSLLATLKPLEGYALAEWQALPAQIATVYSAAAPVMAGLISVFFQQLPLVVSFVTVRD